MKKEQEIYSKTSQTDSPLRAEILAQKDAQIQELFARIQSLAKEKECLFIENTSLSKEKESLSVEKENLSFDKENLIIEVERLKFQVEQFKRMLFGAKRERFVSNQHPDQLALSFQLEEQQLQAQIQADTQKISYERKNAHKPHPGRLALPSHLPVVVTILQPSEDVSGMTCVGQDVTDELEYTPSRLFINRTIRPKYISREDANLTQKQIIAPLDRPIPKCIAGVELLANMAVEKFVFHMPVYRQLQRFAQNGVQIKASTADSWMNLLAKHLQPLYTVHRNYVLAVNYLQVDESPIKVQDKDKAGATHQGYMWVYRAPMQNAVFFDYNRGRSHEAPQKYLVDFKGYLQTDGYVVYDQFGSKPDITHLSCWAHARRYFEKALANDKARASVVMLLLQDLYAVERKAKENELTAEARHELRLEESLPILNKIGKFLADNRSYVLPKSPIGQAFLYCINRWDNLMNYLKDGNLEIDNNQIENAIRPLALGRKNYLFAGSHEGAENIAMYYSFFGTCKKHDINPHKWLAYVIRNIGDTKISELKNLLPQFFDKNRIGG